MPTPIDSCKFTTVAGEFQNSDSPCGTFDQGGSGMKPSRAVRLAACGAVLRRLRLPPAHVGATASTRHTRADYLGFRVSEVPEPGTRALFLMGWLVAVGFGVFF